CPALRPRIRDACSAAAVMTVSLRRAPATRPNMRTLDRLFLAPLRKGLGINSHCPPVKMFRPTPRAWRFPRDDGSGCPSDSHWSQREPESERLLPGASAPPHSTQ